MSKNIQMPVEFLNAVTELLKALESENISEDTQNIAKRIYALLQAKIERIEKRKAFTAYKTSTVGSQSREEARKDYINKAEISKNFTSDKEIYYDKN